MKTRFLQPIASAIPILLAFGASAHAEAPSNDNFASRQTIPSQAQVSVTGTTVDATQEQFEKKNGGDSPAGDGINETKTVWYGWTAPVSGRVHVGFRGASSGQTYLLVFNGATPDLAHVVVQGYEPGGDESPAAADFAVTAGQTYALSLGNTRYPGSFTLTLTLTPGASSPSANVSAPVPLAVRSTGEKGKISFELSTPAAANLQLNYKIAGNAVNGVDYKFLPGAVILPAGQSAALVKIKPLVDPLVPSRPAGSLPSARGVERLSCSACRMPVSSPAKIVCGRKPRSDAADFTHRSSACTQRPIWAGRLSGNAVLSASAGTSMRCVPVSSTRRSCASLSSSFSKPPLCSKSRVGST